MKDMSEDKLLKFLTEAYNDMPKDDMFHTPDPVDDPSKEVDLRLPEPEKSEVESKPSEEEIIKNVLSEYIEDKDDLEYATRQVARALIMSRL